MTGEEIFELIGIFGLVGWIPIWFFFNGIAKVIRAFKGLDDYGYNRNKNKEDDIEVS